MGAELIFFPRRDSAMQQARKQRRNEMLDVIESLNMARDYARRSKLSFVAQQRLMKIYQAEVETFNASEGRDVL